MTATRSQTWINSSASLEKKTMETPARESSFIVRKMSALVPMSTPRVGS